LERRTHLRRAEARVHEKPETDPAVWLLLAVVLVLLALALGTGLSLLLPASI
jgi:hypothetical protein